MTFWAYMLHCRGGYYYTGHTDNLELRMGQHQSGEYPGFASGHLPVQLVWSQEFAKREEALAAERRIKGWSRAKKMALIRGDWDEVSRLAKKKNDGPSMLRQAQHSGRTDGGSGVRTGLPRLSVPPKTVRPELVEGSPLLCSPQTPNAAVHSLIVRAARTRKGRVVVRFQTTIESQAIKIPPMIQNAPRADNLWQSTCFEIFIQRNDGAGYYEFNFAPSTAWAAYGFSGYREAMANAEIITPEFEITSGPDMLDLRVVLDLSKFAGLSQREPWQIAICAVIEETGGTKSYWALRHPPGKPDFHHPDCFALTLPAAGVP